MDVPKTVDEIDSYLFSQGLTITDYYMRGEIIGFVRGGRSYDLIIDHDELYAACQDRLRKLGVEQRQAP